MKGPTMTITDLDNLAALERQIALGNIAMRKRNRLLVTLVDEGHRQTDLMHLINGVRSEMGEPPVTLGAVHIQIRRAREAVA